MFDWLIHKLHKIQETIRIPGQNQPSTVPEKCLSQDLEQNLTSINEALNKSPDLIIRRFMIGLNKSLDASVVYIDGLTDKTIINDHVLCPLMTDISKVKFRGEPSSQESLSWIEEHLITANDLSRVTCLDMVLDAILIGDTALLIEGFSEAIQISTKEWEKRSIQEPETEIVVRGPREGFVESLRTNTALLRRKMGHPNLTFEAMRLGRKTRTEVNIAYVRGIARKELIDEVRLRLTRIDTDAILDVGVIEQFIEDAPFSFFSTIGYSERPEVVASKLLEGRVAILIDGTPVIDTVPMLFIESFQSPDDYNLRPFYATLVRWIRFLSFGLTVFSPGLFVALTSFHQELIPTPLLITISATMEGTPFPTVVEVVGMGIIFEILREAGIRLPRPLGQAVSIVGGLVIGQTAVGAGLIGEPTLIVIALTAIASFAVPAQAEVGALLRLGLSIFAGFFGLYGLLAGFLLILIHLASLRSFGTPYLSPLAPLIPQDLKDSLVRAPIWTLRTRPDSLESQDSTRQRSGLRPKPSDKNNG